VNVLGLTFCPCASARLDIFGLKKPHIEMSIWGLNSRFPMDNSSNMGCVRVDFSTHGDEYGENIVPVGFRVQVWDTSFYTRFPAGTH
jgi:hypothetical protein